MPIVLKTLGASDYGLYSLVAGIVTMLTFLNSSMAVATQRFLSVTIGEGDNEKLNKVYNVSCRLNLLIALVVVFCFEICSFFLFDGFLNIPQERLTAAKLLFQFLTFSTFFTIVSVPYDAVMNANENMLAFSMIYIIDALLKLATACMLFMELPDKLIFYGFSMAIVALINALIKAIYIKCKYKEYSITLHNGVDKKIFKDMFGFAGWTVFGSMAVMGRNQGLAVVLNLFFGTVINATYGIANQVNSLLSYAASTLQKSINPQLMKSEGMQDHQRMLNITYKSTKLSIILSAIIAIPLFIEMPFVLHFWLKEPPMESVIFCRLILLLNVIYQGSAGLMSAIQASGRVKTYQLVIGLLALSSLFVVYPLLKIGFPAYTAVLTLVVFEGLSLIAKVLLSYKIVYIDKRVVGSIIIKSGIVIIISYLCGLGISMQLSPSFLRVLLTTLISCSIFVVLTWFVLFDKSDRKIVKPIITKITKKNEY